jgi:hypothetical protein
MAIHVANTLHHSGNTPKQHQSSTKAAPKQHQSSTKATFTVLTTKALATP